MFACTRKDRLMTRTGSPYLALELRDRTGTITARAFRDADALAGRFERGELVRVSGRVERFRDELVLEVDRDRARRSDAAGASRRASCRPPTATSTSSTASSSTSLARSTTGPTGRCSTGCSPTASCAPRWRRAAVHPGRPPRLPRRAARAHGRGRHARPRALPAASAAELGSAADRGDHPRPRPHPRVHVRRRDRPHRGGPAARPSRDRRAHARRARRRRLDERGGSRCCTACSATTARRPRPAGASRPPRRWRCTASTRSTRASRARSSTGCGMRTPDVVGVDHVQLAAPAGCEAAARRFYGELLGLEEIDKPEGVAASGGAWFVVGDRQLHVGIAEPFVPASGAPGATGRLRPARHARGAPAGGWVPCGVGRENRRSAAVLHRRSVGQPDRAARALKMRTPSVARMLSTASTDSVTGWTGSVRSGFVGRS